MKHTRKHYSEEFKRQVLDDYFQSGMSQSVCVSKWDLSPNTFNTWLCSCRNKHEHVSLRPNFPNSMDATQQAVDNLRIENERLRREVEYQKLKTAGYERLIEIVRLEDGIDLLKKDGAKQ